MARADIRIWFNLIFTAGSIMKTINADDLHSKDMTDPVYREAYESLESEFELVNALLRASRQTLPQSIKITKKSKSA